MPSRLDQLIMCADDAIESVDFHRRMQHGNNPVYSAAQYAITCIKNAIEECPREDPRHNNLTTKLYLMSEISNAYGPQSGLYNNLQYAISFTQHDELDEFEIDEIKNTIEEIKDSVNIFDKLAVGLMASLAGNEYRELALRMLSEYWQTEIENVFISRKEIAEIYNRLI